MIQGNENCEIWYTDVLRLVFFLYQIVNSGLQVAVLLPVVRANPPPTRQGSFERLTVSFGFSIFQLMTSSQN